MATLHQHHTDDVDDQAAALAGWEQRYEQLGCGRFDGQVWQLVMRDGVLLREHTNRRLREQVRPPADHVVMAIPLAVEGGSMFAGQPLERESLMLISGADESDVVSAGDLDLVGLSVHRSLIDGLLSAPDLEWLDQALRRRNLSLAPQAASAIRHLLLAVCADAEAQLDRLDDPMQEQRLLSCTVTQTLLLAMQGEGDSSVPRRADTRLRMVRRAIDFMRAHLQDDIGIPEICAAAYASRRTLQYGFEEFMHTTPQAYLRALRLNEARRQLKQHGHHQAITDLAGAMGFSSASHFTRHYKLMFDELPSQTSRLNCNGAL
jgi:AraC family transcriptional regulator, ethanolamine operon transcriptional activator